MIPSRTCVGCGQRAAKPQLRRFVLTAEHLVLDGSRPATGRGAYLHDNPTCWREFTRRRGPVRSLRATPDRAARVALTTALAAPLEA